MYMQKMGVWVRVAGTISLTMLILAGWTAASLYNWLPADAWREAACVVVVFDIASVLLLLLAQRSGRHIPAGLFLVRFMAAVFVWQLLFDVLGSLFGLFGWACLQLMGWSVPSAVGFILLGGTAMLGLYSVFIEPRMLDRNHLTIPVSGLDENLDGFTIAQLSDVHLGAFVPVSALQRLLDAVVQEKPDVLVITGDLFDSPEPAVNDTAARLLDSYAERFPDGIYYVWGNHEYYRDTKAIRQSLAVARIHELRNSSRLVRAGEPPLYFAGVDYPVTQGVTRVKAPRFVRAACEAVPAGATLIMLAHHPDFFDDAAKAGAVLTLSGHTHGGQMGLFGHTLMPPLFRYWRGLYEQAGHYCYVHKGSGGRFPYRLGCMPEIAYFTLRRK